MSSRLRSFCRLHSSLAPSLSLLYLLFAAVLLPAVVADDYLGWEVLYADAAHPAPPSQVKPELKVRPSVAAPGDAQMAAPEVTREIAVVCAGLVCIHPRTALPQLSAPARFGRAPPTDPAFTS